MKKPQFLTWIAFACIIATVAILVSLTVVLWPPGLVAGLLLAGLFLLPMVATLALLNARQRSPSPWETAEPAFEHLSGVELVDAKLRALTDYERRLEFRELRLARQMRTAQLSGTEILNLCQPDPSDEELDALVRTDRKLVSLIEGESQLAFNRILQNRYAAEQGVNTGLILQDVRDFIERVAKLYRPESDHILLETDIELVAKSFSNASLHLLIVIDDLPLNLKTYNTAKMYRLIRRAVSYYGTYKAFRPYLEHGLNAVQLARLAVGVNPLLVGVAWLAGKLSTHGVQFVGERLLQRRALQLLNDFIRVIGFEAAMMYGGDFAHRDANWVFGAELVNLEVNRGNDFSGRDAALQKICTLVLRNEFDRIQLLAHLARHEVIDIGGVQPHIIMTDLERADIVALLAEHSRLTGVDPKRPEVIRWGNALEQFLGVKFDFLHDLPTSDEAATANPSRRSGLVRWLRSLRRNSGISEKGSDQHGE